MTRFKIPRLEIYALAFHTRTYTWTPSDSTLPSIPSLGQTIPTLRHTGITSVSRDCIPDSASATTLQWLHHNVRWKLYVVLNSYYFTDMPSPSAKSRRRTKPPNDKPSNSSELKNIAGDQVEGNVTRPSDVMSLFYLACKWSIRGKGLFRRRGVCTFSLFSLNLIDSFRSRIPERLVATGTSRGRNFVRWDAKVAITVSPIRPEWL
jgi:hypothetical protein